MKHIRSATAVAKYSLRLNEYLFIVTLRDGTSRRLRRQGTSAAHAKSKIVSRRLRETAIEFGREVSYEPFPLKFLEGGQTNHSGFERLVRMLPNTSFNDER